MNGGADALTGGAGSDSYVFGFDDGEDVITEQGAETDIDRLVLASPVAPKDISVIREGNFFCAAEISPCVASNVG